MAIELTDLEDILLFITGVILIIISLIFFNLFKRYRKRDYALFSLGFLAAAIQIVVRKMDVLFPKDWESELPNFLATLFGFIMVILILFVLVFPQKVPIKFEEQVLNKIIEEE